MQDWVLPSLPVASALFLAVAFSDYLQVSEKESRNLREYADGCGSMQMDLAGRSLRRWMISLTVIGFVFPGICGALCPLEWWGTTWAKTAVALAVPSVAWMGWKVLYKIRLYRQSVEDFVNPYSPPYL